MPATATTKGAHRPATNAENEILFGFVAVESPLRFIFKSTTHADEVHLVDLEEYWHSGKCTCQHFEFRIEPLLSRGMIKPCTPQAWCKHIRKAREMVAQAAINRLAEVFSPRKKTKTHEHEHEHYPQETEA